MHRQKEVPFVVEFFQLLISIFKFRFQMSIRHKNRRDKRQMSRETVIHQLKVAPGNDPAKCSQQISESKQAF